MSDIDELQQRITAAMNRVAQGLDALGGASAGPDAETLQALEDERTANAQLSERVLALKTSAEEREAALRAQIDEGASRMGALDAEMGRLRAANAELEAACRALADANAEGLAAPDLIDGAMKAELESLRAARAVEAEEAAAVLGALTPLLDQASAQGEAV